MIETAAPRELALGADLGGTSTRVLVADRAGLVVGRGRGGPGNPTSSPDLAASSLQDALAGALAGVTPARVGQAVLGVAGGSALAAGPRRHEFDAVLRGAGVAVRPRYVGDVLVAYAAGTASPDGAVLVAGTGASAGQVRAGELVRTSAGHGWLLGDDGSGWWLGREAVRAGLDALDAGEVNEGLARRALAHVAALAGQESTHGEHTALPLGPVDEVVRTAWKQIVVRTINARPPVRLADHSRLVTDAAQLQDPLALDLVARAGAALAAAVEPLLAPGAPLVLAGGLVAPGSVVAAAVRAALSPTRPDVRLVHAGPGEAGAAWLALGRPAAAGVRVRLGLAS